MPTHTHTRAHTQLKTPLSIGQKKSKAIEQLLEELNVPARPIPTEQICVQFNDLRNDILLLLELKAACDVCEYDLQSLKHRYEGLPPEQQAKISLPGMLLSILGGVYLLCVYLQI